MTLYNILNKICSVAIKDKLVNYAAAGSSIYDLNNQTIKDYPIIYISPTGQHEIQENTTTYSLTLFYIDRLLQDSSNDVEIHSTGIEVIKNLILKIEDIGGVVDVDSRYNIQLFTETERMSDRCNGAYAQIRITVLNDTVCVVD